MKFDYKIERKTYDLSEIKYELDRQERVLLREQRL